MDIKSWILSIAGATVLTILADAILPEGETRGYVKSAVSVFIVFLLAFPVPSLVNGEALPDFSFLTEEAREAYIDESLLESLNEKRLRQTEKRLEGLLSGYGIEGAEVRAEATFGEDGMDITLITVSLTNAVIRGESANIIISGRITEIVASAANVGKEAVRIERKNG